VNDMSYSVYKAERLQRRRRRRLLLGVVGLFVVVGVVVGSSYLWLYLQWQKTQIDDPDLSAVLSSTPLTNPYPVPAGTMNVLILGIDNLGGTAIRSDSMMVLHVDPAGNYLSVLSLPRDLRVEVPGSGTNKLNFAYAHGGAELAIQTVELLTGVDITHYMEISWSAFKSLTDAVGGVYMDVDKRYYNSDATVANAIDIVPGYQLLSGSQALDLCRWRHDSNMDFGRQLRQQRFLAALREQAMGWDLGFKLPGLIDALTSNIRTTISFEEIRNLIYWALTDLGGGNIRQVTIVGDIQTIEGVSYVIPADGVLEQRIQQLMTPAAIGSDAQTTVGTTPAGVGVNTNTVTEPVEPVDSSMFITDANLIRESPMWKTIASQVSFAVMAPGYVPEGYIYFQKNPENGGTYDIDTGGGTAKGLKLVYQLNRDGQAFGQYLGIMETDWVNAPAASPGQQVIYNGTTFTIVGTYDSTERVWWVKDGVLYWVSNTISHYLKPSELVKMAASMIPIPSGATP
jgi:LCP family protein required for cell wall assembly